MFFCSKHQIPRHISSYFHLNYNVHNYDTRSASNYHIPHIRTKVSKESIFYKGPVIFNNLASNMRDSPSLKGIV